MEKERYEKFRLIRKYKYFFVPILILIPVVVVIRYSLLTLPSSVSGLVTIAPSDTEGLGGVSVTTNAGGNYTTGENGLYALIPHAICNENDNCIITVSKDRYKTHTEGFELAEGEGKTINVKLCPDNDNDNFSALGGECGADIDCDDNDPNIYPGSSLTVKLDPPFSFHSVIQNAYVSSHPTSTMQLRDVVIPGDVSMDSTKDVTVKSGRDCDYGTSVGTTTIDGDMSVSKGKIIIADGTLKVEKINP